MAKHCFLKFVGDVDIDLTAAGQGLVPGRILVEGDIVHPQGQYKFALKTVNW